MTRADFPAPLLSLDALRKAVERMDTEAGTNLGSLLIEAILADPANDLLSPAHGGTAMSDKPVAWRVKDFADGWIIYQSEEEAKRYAVSAGNLVEPLYTRAQSDLIPLPAEVPEDLDRALAEAHWQPSAIKKWWADFRSSYGQPRASQAMSVEGALVKEIVSAAETWNRQRYGEVGRDTVDGATLLHDAVEKRKAAIERARAAKEG